MFSGSDNVTFKQDRGSLPWTRALEGPLGLPHPQRGLQGHGGGAHLDAILPTSRPHSGNPDPQAPLPQITYAHFQGLQGSLPEVALPRVTCAPGLPTRRRAGCPGTEPGVKRRAGARRPGRPAPSARARVLESGPLRLNQLVLQVGLLGRRFPNFRTFGHVARGPPVAPLPGPVTRGWPESPCPKLFRFCLCHSPRRASGFVILLSAAGSHRRP